MRMEASVGAKAQPPRANGSLARLPGESRAKDPVDENMRPSRAEAEAAVRTLIRWAGDDPTREGLRETPGRVTRAYEEWFRGYGEDPNAMLSRTFEETGGYAGPVLLKDIRFESHCEHHMAPITGVVHLSYLPRDRVVGISKLVRLVQLYSKRLQIQERLTNEIAEALMLALQPLGVGVVVVGAHGCMTTRGVNNHSSTMITSCFQGDYRRRSQLRNEFLSSIQKGSGYGCLAI